MNSAWDCRATAGQKGRQLNFTLRFVLYVLCQLLDQDTEKQAEPAPLRNGGWVIVHDVL